MGRPAGSVGISVVVGRRIVEHEIADGEQIADGEKLVQEVESKRDGGHLIVSNCLLGTGSLNIDRQHVAEMI